MAAPRPYSEYLRAAFKARPAGMFVVPNWIGLGVFGLLGMLNPGFWLLGVGLEAVYLFALANHPRFRRVVEAEAAGSGKGGADSADRARQMREALPPQDRNRYGAFLATCRATVQALPGNTTVGDSLAHVSWLYLQLLTSRQSVAGLLRAAEQEAEEEGTFEERLAKLDRRLREETTGEDLKRTLESTREILLERQQAREQMSSKLGYLDAELSRLEEQVSLLHDRARLDQGSAGLSGSIDRVTSGIRGATEWMSREKELLGDLSATLDEPPPPQILETEP